MHRILSLASVAALIPVSALLIVLFTEEATGAEQRLMREVVVDGLRSPWAIAFVSADEALITEKEGGLKRVHLRKGSVTDITNLPGDIVTGIRAENRADNGAGSTLPLIPILRRIPSSTFPMPPRTLTAGQQRSSAQGWMAIG